MALNKNIILENGVLVSYHRIVSINNIVNQRTLIEVGSYTSKEFRDKEKRWYTDGCKGVLQVYINTEFHQIDYVKDINVDNAYEYLKTLDIFADAEDVFEDKTIEEPQEEIIEEEIVPEDGVLEENTTVDETTPEESTTDVLPEETTEEEIIPEESTNNEEEN